jgi:hypothetical protein
MYYHYMQCLRELRDMRSQRHWQFWVFLLSPISKRELEQSSQIVQLFLTFLFPIVVFCYSVHDGCTHKKEKIKFMYASICYDINFDWMLDNWYPLGDQHVLDVSPCQGLIRNLLSLHNLVMFILHKLAKVVLIKRPSKKTQTNILLAFITIVNFIF